MRLFTVEAIRRMEAAELGRGTDTIALMQRAADGVARVCGRFDLCGKRVVAFCGGGKNGGDGYGAARLLLAQKAEVICLLTAPESSLTPETAEFRARFVEAGGVAAEFNPSDADTVELCRHADLIIDAVYGTGGRPPLSGTALEAARMMNWSPAPVVSVDVPTGASADTGAVGSVCVKADVTAALGFDKPVYRLEPSRSYCGEIVICDIGVPPDDAHSDIELFDKAMLSAALPSRRRDSHKYDYARVLVVGGSIGMSGAPMLAANAALRSGAGVSSVHVPERVWQVCAPMCPEVMVRPVADDEGALSRKALAALLEAENSADIVVLGCGAGRSKETTRLICEYLAASKKPIVLDADGINAVSANINILRERKSETILTPHDGEFSRLGGVLKAGRANGAASLAASVGAFVVLKGSATVTASPDGRVLVNETGNAGMATAGSGDALAGVIAAICGGAPTHARIAAAVRLHGTAGDLAAEAVGQYGMTASDIITYLPQATKHIK